MEAVPRLPMISFDLKTSPDRQPPEFGKLKQYIRNFYNEDPESYSAEIHKLEALHATAMRPAVDVTGCSVLKKYFCQLHFLQSRFPMGKDGAAAINFTWRDAYASMVCTMADIRFEMVSVLYNIGALHSQLGADDARATAEGLKLACTHLQCAAWAFQHLKDTYPQPSGVDVSPDLMQFMHMVCLAQAQECILEKSMTDNRKATINAKVAAQIVEYYNMALNALTHSGTEDGSVLETVGSKLFKSWKQYVRFKRTYYGCVGLLYQGQQSEEQQKMGERVAYYQAACDKLNEAVKLTKGLDQLEVIEEALTFTNDVVEGKKKAAKNENEFIYHEEVPERDQLAEVRGAALVKGIPFSVTDQDISGPDIFGRLVPMKAHEASSLYSEEKAKLLRKMGGAVDEADQQLVGFMTSLQLDYVNAHTEPDRLPQDIIDICAALSAKPDAIQNLIDAMDKLSDIYQDVDAMLKEILEWIQNEEEEEAEYQEVMGGRPPSIVATDLTREANKYEEAHKKAAESNLTLHKAMTQHVANLRLLELPLSQLAEQIPSLAPLKLGEQPVVREMQHLVSKVDEMRHQRATLATQLRESVCADDITGRLVVEDSEREENVQKVFAEEIAKHDKYVKLLEQNISAQNNIVKALTDTYAQYAPVRRATMEVLRQRNSTLNALMSSYDAYEDLIAKSAKGQEFYRKLETNVTKLLQRVKGTCKVQQEERDSILAKNHKKLPSKTKNSDHLEGPTQNDLPPSTAPKLKDTGGPKLKDYLESYKRDKSSGFSVNPGQITDYYNAGMPLSKQVYPDSSNPYDSSQPWVPSVRPAPVGQEGTCPTTSAQDLKPEQNYPGYTPNYSMYTNKIPAEYNEQYANYMSQYQLATSNSQYQNMPQIYGKVDPLGYPKPNASVNYPSNAPSPQQINSANQSQNTAPGQNYPQPSPSPQQNYPQPSSTPLQNYPQPSSSSQLNYPQPSLTPQQNYSQTPSTLQNYPQPGSTPQQNYPQPGSTSQQNYPQPGYTPQQNYPQPSLTPQHNYSQPSSTPQQNYPQPTYDPYSVPTTLPGYTVPTTLPQGYSGGPQQYPNQSYSPTPTQPVNYTSQMGQTVAPQDKYPSANYQQVNPQYPNVGYSVQAQNIPQAQSFASASPQHNTTLSSNSQAVNYQTPQGAYQPPAVTQSSTLPSIPNQYENPAATYPQTATSQPQSMAAIDQTITNNFASLQNQTVTTTTNSMPGSVTYPPNVSSEKTEQVYSQYQNIPTNYSTPASYPNPSKSVTQEPAQPAESQYSTYIPQMYSSFNQYSYSGLPPWQASYDGSQPAQYYTPAQGMECQYSPATSSSYYTSAGLPNLQTSASSSQPVRDVQPNYTQGNYYQSPYGYQYTTGSTQSVTSESPSTPKVFPAPNPGQVTPLSPMTYMQSSKSNLTLTQSDKSNVDLLAGLDFSISQDPLVPQTRVTDSQAKPVISELEGKLASVNISQTTAMPAPVQPNSSSNSATSTPKKSSEKRSDCKFQLKDAFTDSESLNQFAQEVDKFEKFVEGLTVKTLNGPTPLDLKWKELLDLQEKDAAKRVISVARCYPVKNRFPDILPYDNSRVELPSTKDDYINASYVKDVTPNFPEFIVTQLPLASTLADFWTMVLECQVELVVCLLNDTELEGVEGVYWPQERGAEASVSLGGGGGQVTVTLQSRNASAYWVERILHVADARMARTVVHLQFTKWPGSVFPTSPGPFLALVTEALNVRSQQRGPGPIVVHCMAGVGRAGLFLLAAAAACHIHSARGLPDLTVLTACISAWRKHPLRDREHFKFAHHMMLYYTQDLLMKCGILAGKSSFEDKRPHKTHTRHPSEDFLLGPPPVEETGSKPEADKSTEETPEPAPADPLSQLDPLWSLNKAK